MNKHIDILSEIRGTFANHGGAREEIEALDAAIKSMRNASPVPKTKLEPIEHAKMMDRTYIPLPGGWEIQTKGKGSTFRICDPQGERLAIPDSPYLHDTLERMAREVHAAAAVLSSHPDAHCVTQEDGQCISTHPCCMHNREAQPRAAVREPFGWFVFTPSEKGHGYQETFTRSPVMKALVEASISGAVQSIPLFDDVPPAEPQPHDVPEFNQRMFGMACTIAWTELVTALRTDGHTVSDKSGPTVKKWIEGIVRDTFRAAPQTREVRAQDGVLPDELVPHSDEWYRLCERRFSVYRTSISGDLAKAIVACIVRLNQPTTPAPQDAAGVEERCSRCDGTGDVHRADGEYVGVCDCTQQPGAAEPKADLLISEEERNALNGLLSNLEHEAGDVEDSAPNIKDAEDAYWAYHQWHGITKLLHGVAPLQQGLLTKRRMQAVDVLLARGWRWVRENGWHSPKPEYVEIGFVDPVRVAELMAGSANAVLLGTMSRQYRRTMPVYARMTQENKDATRPTVQS